MTETAELIPRKMLFGNPERTEVKLSHDGERVAYLAPVDGVLNVWVAPVDAIDDARPVTQDTDRGIRFYTWTYNPAYLLYAQDRGGDEDWHVYAVNVETEVTSDLTPYEGVNALPPELSERYPDEILVPINRRDPQLHDFYRVNILTGESRLVVKNDFGAARMMADRNLNPRLARVVLPDGGASILTISESGEREVVMTVDPEDELTTFLQYFDAEGRTLYAVDSRGRDTSAFVSIDTETWETTELAIDPRADVYDTLEHPKTGRPQAVTFEYDRESWKVLDDSIAADLKRIADKEKGEFDVRSRSLDDRRWIVRYERDDGPKPYYLYERDTGELEYLFSDRPELETASLARMHSAVVESRDGLDLIVYYSLPVGSTDAGSDRPDEPLPAVLLVHGALGPGTPGGTTLYTSSWRTGAMRSSA
jgi:dipeptidyl aminopeptidase/acylaminoacyl peptidase